LKLLVVSHWPTRTPFDQVVAECSDASEGDKQRHQDGIIENKAQPYGYEQTSE
jgi:hypothetical protein